jgi:uncharacterized protein YpuA (DUF1002 family)
MVSLLGMFVGKRILGRVIGPKASKAIVIAGLVLAALALFFIAKGLYDRSLIEGHTAEQRAEAAEADLKATEKAGEERRVDDSRLAAEGQQIKEAITNAGPSQADRRRAYYDCVKLQQSARARGQPPADC